MTPPPDVPMDATTTNYTPAQHATFHNDLARTQNVTKAAGRVQARTMFK